MAPQAPFREDAFRFRPAEEPPRLIEQRAATRQKAVKNFRRIQQRRGQLNHLTRRCRDKQEELRRMNQEVNEIRSIMEMQQELEDLREKLRRKEEDCREWRMAMESVEEEAFRNGLRIWWE